MCDTCFVWFGPVPDLVNQILLNGGGLKSALEGFIIGNPVLSCPEWEATANTIQVELFYWHALIPYSAYLNWKSSGCAVPNANPSKTCVDLLNEITDMVGPFDSDNLYTDLVSGNATLGIGPTPDHTISELLTAYLNRPDVQSAIHARPTSWCACCSEPGQPGGKCELNYTNAFPDMMPYYNRFFEIVRSRQVHVLWEGLCAAGCVCGCGRCGGRGVTRSVGVCGSRFQAPQLRIMIYSGGTFAVLRVVGLVCLFSPQRMASDMCVRPQTRTLPLAHTHVRLLSSACTLARVSILAHACFVYLFAPAPSLCVGSPFRCPALLVHSQAPLADALDPLDYGPANSGLL